MRGSFRAHGISLVALVAAVALRWLLDPVVGDAFPFVTLFGAVAIAVWVGGPLLAAIVAGLGFLACDYLFMSPRGTFDLITPASIAGMLAYLFTCAVIIGIGGAMRAAQRRAAERGELLAVTLESIGDAVLTTDNEGRITYLNAVAEALTGWKSAEARGLPLDSVFRIVREDDRSPMESPAARALREGVAVGLANHTVLLAKDGSERPIDDSAAPIRDEDGTVSGCVLIFRDISGRRRSELAEAHRALAARELAAIVESSDDAIVSKSLAGVIRSWNSGAERLFGHSAEQAIGKHISLVIPSDRLAEEDEIIATLKAGRRIDHFETERVRSDGTRIAVSLTVSPILDDSGTVVGASKIVRDVSERRRLEVDLRNLANDLAEVDRRKNEFLATLSHELRNPLAPMRNMLEVLKRTGGDPRSLPQALDTMERQLEQLVRLVDDLLDLNRINHNRIELRRIETELEPLVRQAVEGARPLADSAGHEIRVVAPAEPILLLADPVRLTQVFGNLLNNSCKYTAPGGAITVTLERRGSEAVIRVSDTGTGIPTDKLETIFEMFTQVERSLELSQGGLGIGLTLVKRLVELHGGTVEARSAGEDRGSEFEVRLPALDRATAAPVAAREVGPEAQRKARVLVVDDNHDAAASLALLLKMSGYESLIANDGVEAVETIERERPDVVLLDLGLPRLNGHEVCRKVRDQPWGREIRIVALTGWGQDEDRARSEEAGFDDHLVKPVDFDELLKLLA